MVEKIFAESRRQQAIAEIEFRRFKELAIDEIEKLKANNPRFEAAFTSTTTMKTVFRFGSAREACLGRIMRERRPRPKKERRCSILSEQWRCGENPIPG
jgi:hypothetical protein